jgi:HD-GYP domain-containing protein (c-di-GMP phosphodiesterase class II)
MIDTTDSISHSQFRRRIDRMLGRIGLLLVEPSKNIPDLAKRRNARLLSIIMLCLFGLFLCVNLAYLLTVPRYSIPIADLIGYGFLLVSYILSRSRFFPAAIVLLLIMFPLNVFENIYGGTSINIVATLLFLIPGFILVSIFTGPWITALYGYGINLVILLVPFLAPKIVPDASEIYGNLAVGVIVVTLCVVWIIHRNQIEHDRTMELKKAYDSTLEGWSNALELRDKETKGHCQRVTNLAVRLGRALGLRSEELESLIRGAMLHDIGKMGIPDSILMKPEALDNSEWAVMRTHPKIAYDMLNMIPFLQEAMTIPHYHHEWWNGQGYPEHLQGDQIPLLARIFAVVDVWDALLSDRPYRKAWTKEQAVLYLKAQSGKQFDPKIVAKFFTLKI